MRAVSKKKNVIFAALFAAATAWPHTASADKIGSSSLPAATPALKGRIADDQSATSVVVVTTGIGATTNAGPTLDEIPSVFIERGGGYATFWQTDAGRIDLSVNLSDRLYPSYDQAYEQNVALGLTWTKDWAGQQTLVALALNRSRDVEERLVESSVSITHAWTTGRIKPYVRAETALLDYQDVPGDFQPFTNQDDRDRLSSRAQLGLRTTITNTVELEVGAGVDNKHYSQRYDDFGVQRDSISPFPLIGLAYAASGVSLKGLYMPFLRLYRDDLFEEKWRHGYALEAEAKLTDSLKAFASARYGFEETDFLIASSAYQSVALAGVVLTVGKASLTLAASETLSDYADLELVDVARFDRKFEVALTGEMPLIDTISLNGRISYLDYRSTFGYVGTDAWTASVGLTYAATH